MDHRILSVSEAWRSAYPDSIIGVLAMSQVTTSRESAALAGRKKKLEEALQARFEGYSRSDLKRLPAVQAYVAYYKRFKKSYHVLLQLESVAFRNKPIPRVSPMVEVMFMAELKNQLLTAGHDLDRVESPVTVKVAEGDEDYTTMGGGVKTLKEGDMYIADGRGVISSIIYGPDRRTRIRPSTTRVLFAVYAPRGVGKEAVESHLQDIEENILLIAPEASVMERTAYGAR